MKAFSCVSNSVVMMSGVALCESYNTRKKCQVLGTCIYKTQACLSTVGRSKADKIIRKISSSKMYHKIVRASWRD